MDLRKVWSDERRKNHSLALKGRVFTEEHKRKISEANKGRCLSEGQIRKMLETRVKGSWRENVIKASKNNKYWLGRKHTVEEKEKIRLAHLGKVRSDEERRKISEGKKGKCSDKLRVHLLSLPQSKKGVPHGEFSEEHKKNISLSRLGKKASDETRVKLSLARRNDPFLLERLKRNREKLIGKGKMTEIEKKVMLQLNELGEQYIFQYYLENKYYYDFFVLGKGLIIECDGDYWHSIDKVRRIDAEKDSLARKYGYEILRISGSVIMRRDFAVGDFIGR